MVKDRVTDGTRIAQLLASELDGREDGSLARVRVVNAEEAVESSDGGGKAFDVAVDDAVVARVSLHPEGARVSFVDEVETALGAAESAGLGGRRKRQGSGKAASSDEGSESGVGSGTNEGSESGVGSGTDEGSESGVGSGTNEGSAARVVVPVESGAEVKWAVDVVIAVASAV